MSRELCFYIPILRIFALTLSIKVPIIVYSTLCFSPKITTLNPFIATEKGEDFTHGRIHSI